MQQGFQQYRMGTLERVAIFGIAIRFFYGPGLPSRRLTMARMALSTSIEQVGKPR